MDDARERGGWLEGGGGRTEEAKQGGEEGWRRSDWIPVCDTCGMIAYDDAKERWLCVCAKQGNCQVEELGKSRVELMQHGGLLR